MTINPLQQIIASYDTELWRTVPLLVTLRYKEAASLEQALRAVVKRLPSQSDYGYVFWNPDTKTVHAVLGDSDTEQTHQRWANALKGLYGVQHVKTTSEVHPSDPENWIRIKTGAAFSWLNAPYEAAGKLTGGPSPMSNAIVSGLLGGGLGYGAGAAMEHLFPEQYVERGRLRKTLGLLGAGAGAALHVPQAVANSTLNQHATGEPRWFDSIFRGDSAQQVSPDEQAWQRHHMGVLKEGLAGLPEIPQQIKQAVEKFASMTGFEPLRPVPVDAFNRAIWNDVHNGSRSSQSNMYGTRSPYDNNSSNFHTPPANAAAASGLVTGVQQMYGNAPVLTPKHFIHGLAAAGTDLVTARIAGGVLGALGGLTPAAQKKVQDMGLWGGMIRGVTGSVLGLH